MTGTYGVDGATPDGEDVVTLVTGDTFLICRPDGSIGPGGLEGYYAADTRMLSLLEVRVDGARPRLASTSVRPRGREDARAGPDAPRLDATGTLGDPTAPHTLVRLCLQLCPTLLLEVEVEDLVGRARTVAVDLTFDSDFADVFQVKRGEVARHGRVLSGRADDAVLLAYENGGFRRALRARPDRPADLLRDGIAAALDVAARGCERCRFTFVPETGHHQEVRLSEPSGEARRWRRAFPVIADDDDRFEGAWRQSGSDLTSLLMQDPAEPTRTIVAAGSPWFLALFGRDSLLTAMATLPIDTALTVSVLQALAARQGREVVARTAEEPGRILHEVRSGESVRSPGGWGDTYYGSVDATPLFVMALAEAHRWGAPEPAVRELLPAAERAVAWMFEHGDLDGDGLVEYPGVGRQPPAGPDPPTLALVNLGWKDSDDAIVWPDGELVEGPIALVEVQGYCHAALLGLAGLREALGTGDPEPLVHAAARLSAAIEDAFWCPSEDCYALCLDGAKRAVPTVSSNAGHLLWAGAARTERAAATADRLMASDVFTGFGLRTLSAGNAAYNPLSYHRGSVWPHDTAMAAAGMYRYGITAAGDRLALGLLGATDSDGRLPELFGGFPRERFDRPVPYPSSCAPQAWSAAAAITLVAAATGRVPGDDRPWAFPDRWGPATQ